MRQVRARSGSLPESNCWRGEGTHPAGEELGRSPQRTRSGVPRLEAWDPSGRAFDVVLAGQTWHWVDPVAGPAKAAEVLRLGGRLTVFRNADKPSADLVDAFGEVYRPVMPDAFAGRRWTGRRRLWTGARCCAQRRPTECGRWASSAITASSRQRSSKSCSRASAPPSTRWEGASPCSTPRWTRRRREPIPPDYQEVTNKEGQRKVGAAPGSPGPGTDTETRAHQDPASIAAAPAADVWQFRYHIRGRGLPYVPDGARRRGLQDLVTFAQPPACATASPTGERQGEEADGWFAKCAMVSGSGTERSRSHTGPIDFSGRSRRSSGCRCRRRTSSLVSMPHSIAAAGSA